MEVDLSVLLAGVRDSPQSSSDEIVALHKLVITREIEDYEDASIKDMCETLWLSLRQCWSKKAYTKKENMAWETLTWFLSLPSFTSNDEDISLIGSTIPKDFCNQCKIFIHTSVTA